MSNKSSLSCDSFTVCGKIRRVPVRLEDSQGTVKIIDNGGGLMSNVSNFVISLLKGYVMS